MIINPSGITDTNNASKWFYDVLFYLSVDVDECQLNMTDPRRHGCEHECINANGGYACRCRPGYRFHADLRSCRGKFTQIMRFQVLFLKY